MNNPTLHQVQKAFEHYESHLLNMTPTLQAAVLLPLLEKNQDPHLLLEVRSSLLRRQPGDISFPGGKIDPQDASPWAAAQRETCEELGISPQEIHLIRPLDTLVSPFGVNLHCFLAEISSTDFTNFNKDEVEEIFTLPLSWLIETPPLVYPGTVAYIPDEGFPYHQISGGKSYQFSKPPYPSYFYHYENHTIWGMTAFILKHFAQQLQERI